MPRWSCQASLVCVKESSTQHISYQAPRGACIACRSNGGLRKRQSKGKPPLGSPSEAFCFGPSLGQGESGASRRAAATISASTMRHNKLSQRKSLSSSTDTGRCS